MMKISVTMKREGDVADEMGNVNGAWRRQSVIGI
jgi:hypothetical protein